ncbi:MAG: DUF5667 domain-containing protein [Patescibacteria group bacterium]
MMDKNLKKGIREFEKVKLTPGEKLAIFNRVSTYADSNPVTGALKSPFFGWTFVFAHERMRYVYASIAITLILATGAGTAFAAERSLPGDFLYPIKINVTEPVKGALKVGSEAKIKWEGNKAVKRLEEAEKLAEMGQLDEGKRQTVEREFEKSADTFIKKVDDQNEGNGQSEYVNSVQKNFEQDVEIQLKRINQRKVHSSKDQKDEIDNLEIKVKEKINSSKGNHGNRDENSI